MKPRRLPQTQAEFSARFHTAAAAEMAGWEFCPGEDAPPFLSHEDCDGGWELWATTDRGGRMGSYQGEAILLAGPFDL